jgi:hypothetical protein
MHPLPHTSSWRSAQSVKQMDNFTRINTYKQTSVQLPRIYFSIKQGIGVTNLFTVKWLLKGQVRHGAFLRGFPRRLSGTG